MLQKVIIAAEGEAKVRDNVPAEEAAQLARSFYHRIGGEDFFRRLTQAFYRRVATDELLAPLFNGAWEHHSKRLAYYFIQLYGEADLQAAWEPRVLTAHTRFVITNAQRLRWLELMQAAGNDVSADEQLMTDFMGVLTIASLDMAACSRGAAIARGQRIDRLGNVLSPAADGDRH